MDLSTEDKILGFLKGTIPFVNISEKVLEKEPWNIDSWVEPEIIIRAETLPLGDICREICKGINPGGSTDIFVVPFDDGIAKENGIQRTILGTDIQAYSLSLSGLMIFPYVIDKDNNCFVPNFSTLGEWAKKRLTSSEQGLKNRDYVMESGKSWFELWNQRSPSSQLVPKLVICNMSNRNRFAYDSEGAFLTIHTVYSVILKDEYIQALGYPFIMSILNSSLLTYLFNGISTKVRGGYLRYSKFYLEKLPIRRIPFTTPPTRRAALFEEAKALYSGFDPAFKCEDSLGAPDSQKILEFVSVRLGTQPEESDVVHDLLAYLAERMIEMNKEKNAEIKGFLRWLEGEIGAPVEELSNKTAIKEYYEHGFEALAGAIAKNKKKLKDGYDSTRREPKERLQAEFNVSVGKLAPLLRRIEVTDGLIDAIVYRLYGLTEDEIKIVKESISGKTNEKGSKTTDNN